MTIRDMLGDALRAKGYDGLWLDDSEDIDGCGCHIGDLAPCGRAIDHIDGIHPCRPGYAQPNGDIGPDKPPEAEPKVTQTANDAEFYAAWEAAWMWELACRYVNKRSIYAGGAPGILARAYRAQDGLPDRVRPA